MIGRPWAVLLNTRKAELATPANSRGEADTHKGANADVVVNGPHALAERDNPTDALVTAKVRELDIRDGLAVCASCGTSRRV